MLPINPQVNSLAPQYRLALFTCLLAFCVILMGAYVRLSDAGLGCPDWPGCYGQLIVPSGQQAAADTADDYARPLHTGKAWKEMIHRYLAGSLGLLVLLLTVMAWRNWRLRVQPLLIPSLLLVLVSFQAALGMWTVTLLVKPAIVTAHLLGGFATFVLLWLLSLRLGPSDRWSSIKLSAGLRIFSRLALVILILQICLGGWTSTNYAALGCSDFPGCYPDQWWPAMDFREAFVPWRGLGINYEFGVLDNEARAAIHMTHRLGALLTLLVIGTLSLRLIWTADELRLRTLGQLLLILLLAQIALGVTNVLGHLPLTVALAHNGVAALLLATLATLTWISRRDE